MTLKTVPVLPLARSSTAVFNSCSRCFLLWRLLCPGNSLRTPPLPPDLLLPSWLRDRALCLVGDFSTVVTEWTELVRKSWMVSSTLGSDNRRLLDRSFFTPFNWGEGSGMTGATWGEDRAERAAIQGRVQVVSGINCPRVHMTLRATKPRIATKGSQKEGSCLDMYHEEMNIAVS